MNELTESLLKCRVDGNTLYLPPISDGPLHNYAQVRQSLLSAGAKYKKNAFVFPSDAQSYIDRLTGGEKVNIKKEFQFFGTPDSLADDLVFEAQIKPFHAILEPSAGQGALIKAIHRVLPSVMVDWYEAMPTNQTITQRLPNQGFLGADFLERKDHPVYDRIIANPPFAKNQDIDHIYKMYANLKPGGRIVTIASSHWKLSSNKKETTFKNWLDELSADMRDIDAGEFSESGTKVATCMIVIDKPL